MTMEYLYNVIDTDEARVFLACARIFSFTAFFFLMAILGSRIFKTYQAFRSKKLQEEFQKIVNALIILEHGRENTSQFSLEFHLMELRKETGTKFRKQVLVDVLIANKLNLTGTSAVILQKVFGRLHLEKFSYSKLKSIYSLRKVKGLQELAEMECVEYLSAIQELFNHRKLIVRQESFIAMLRLSCNSPFVLVDHYRGVITPWMQLTIHKHLAKLPSDKLPKFYRWFYSSKNEIKKFAIIMAHQFKQLEAIPHIIFLLDEIDTEIAGLAVEFLGDIGAEEYVTDIVRIGQENFLNENLSLKVIQALGQIGNGKQHGSFLAWHMVHGSLAVRFEAMRVMHKLNLNCRDFLIDVDPANAKEFESIFAHITTPLLF